MKGIICYKCNYTLRKDMLLIYMFIKYNNIKM